MPLIANLQTSLTIAWPQTYLYKSQTSFIIKSLLCAKEYQHIDMQFLTYQITLKPLLTNSNCLLRHTRKSIQRRYKLSLQTDDFIKETITITIITVATPYITATNRNHVALYIIKKDIAYRYNGTLQLRLRQVLLLGQVYRYDKNNNVIITGGVVA